MRKAMLNLPLNQKDMIEQIAKIVMCHIVGDYLFQTDYMAREKGKDLYVLLAHCVCYAVPFAIVFGVDHRIIWLILTHFVIDALKARYKLFGILIDQFLHYAIVGVLYLQ